MEEQYIVPQSAVQRMLAVNAEFESIRVMKEQMVELLRDTLGAPQGWILRYDNGVMHFVDANAAQRNGMMESIAQESEQG